jgi:serine/threonine protein phosphatase PrpC
MPVRSVLLLGDDHTELGEMAVAGVPPAGALALSRGKFPKGYTHFDPNEDAALVATDGAAWLLAVADGHNGFDAARAAITAVHQTAASTLQAADADLHAALTSAVAAAHRALEAALSDAESWRAASATTLAVALVVGDQLAVASFGDSMVAVIRDQRLIPINRPSPFLVSETDPTGVQIDQTTLVPGDVVLAATDGLTDFLGRRGRRSLPRALSGLDQPTVSARLAVEHAFAGGAGDNIGVALLLHRRH